MTAWPSPQSSVQITGKVPCRSGVITRVVSRPGTASCFWPNSGTQNECITSSDVIRSLVVTLIGSFSVAEVSLPKPGYWKLQANCWAVTLTTSGVSLSDEAAEACGMCSFLASTTALTIEIAVTRTAGTAVQTISRPVLPWIGGPSASSPGCARNLTDRVEDHGGDEREDRDADRGHEPEDEVDPAGLLARGVRHPRDQERDERGARAADGSDRDELDDRSPTHRRRDYWTGRAARRGKCGRSKRLLLAGFDRGANG